MEPSKDPISVRITRLNNQILGKQDEKCGLNREGLFDALQILYDECNTEYMRSNDKNIANFVDKYKKYVLELKKSRVNVTDFEIKNVVGRGHFGEVHVVKERQTGDIYAMKTVRKYDNSKEKQAHFEEERNIMAQAASSWITKLQYAFQDSCSLFYVMEFHPGGDLLGLLYRQGGSIPESAATFYLAELICAINDLHNMGYVHRDIKPDNILLDRCGHLKLVDFGSATKLNSQGLVNGGSMPVGTPDYIAPETLQSLESKSVKSTYGKPCDYWSLGVMAYELTIGHAPFSGQSTTATYSKIMNYGKSLKFPSDLLLTQAYINLIKNLLVEQSIRLDYEKCINHSLFKNVDFESLRNQVPPFVPKITSEDDTSNFSEVQTNKRPPNMANYKSKGQFNGKNLPFLGFTYAPEPKECRENYKAIVANDEKVDGLKKEIEKLEKQLITKDLSSQDKANLEKKLEEKSRKLETVESIRNKLEKELANNIAECQAIKRTLEIERKDRSDLERKALELIKSAKLKWEAAEKIKFNNLQEEMDEYKSKIVKLNEEITVMKGQLIKAEKLSDKQKCSIENVEKLRRSSVIGLESRLEKVTVEAQSQLSFVQKQLAEKEAEKKYLERRILELEDIEQQMKSKLELSEKDCRELKTKCKESEEVINTLKSEVGAMKNKCLDLDFHKELVKELENKLHDLQTDTTVHQKLKKMDEANAVLNKQVKDLKGELNNIRASKQSSIEDLKKDSASKITQLEDQIKALKDGKNECELKLQETLLSLQTKNDKIEKLESQLQESQGDLAKLETGSERECVLKEQIQRLEQQLVEISSQSAVEKQEMGQLRTKCWRLEKDITNAELDKKIVERDLKEERQLNKSLRDDMKNMEKSLNDLKKSKESALGELAKINDDTSGQVEQGKKEIKKLESKLEEYKQKEEYFLDQIKKLENEVEDKELKICTVLEALDVVKKERTVVESKFKEMQLSNQKKSDELMSKDKEILTLQNSLEKCNSDLQNSLLNRKALRDACTLLENQLIEFETILDCTEIKKQTMQIEMQKLQDELTKYKNDVLEARRKYNEEKSLKLLAETKCKRVLDDLSNNQKEVASFSAENADLKDLTKKLNEELGAMEVKMGEYEITLKSYERQLEDYIAENKYLKEETTDQLTFINSMKESNYSLGKRYNESQSIIKDMMDKIQEMDLTLREKGQYFKERELKFEATIQQQTKLIDFLQSKVEESTNKKKTLSEKLFGIHTKKENVPPMSVVLNYKDLETQLQKEKEQNKNLYQELVKLKSELFKKTEGDAKTITKQFLKNQDDIMAQIVQSPSAQKNDHSRHNTVQRMKHNIPHRMDSKLCTKATKCAQCNNQILLGRHMCVCRECQIVAHTNCASSLPKTCGLPSEYALHYSERISKLNSESSWSLQSTANKFEETNLEGWVKIPVVEAHGWERHYACLTKSSLKIYKEPPNSKEESKPIQKIKLESMQGKVILEPVPSEIPVPVANSDLPFIIKVETSPNSSCWPSQALIFMTLSVVDKDKWFSCLLSMLQPKNSDGEIILHDAEDLNINCMVDINGNTKLLGTESGLYSLQKNKLVRIDGLQVVHEIQILRHINAVVMLAEQKRILISCDLNHLSALCDCAPCSKPSLKYQPITVKNLDGFHILKATDSKSSNYVCTATAKSLIIIKHNDTKNEFEVQRVLDTAQPVSCILFTDHTVVIGADKFFEVDLITFVADEFLDASDSKLSHAVKCFRMKSFPISVIQISANPREYLVCFNEFATFVDEFGRSTRRNDIYWTYMPKAFYYDGKYLYVVQFNAVEIYKITNYTCNGNEDETLQAIKVELPQCQFLGENVRGIYVLSGKQIRFVSGSNFDDSASASSTGTLLEKFETSSSDRFSFTSSMVQSLDGHLSDEDIGNTYTNNKKVQFTDF